MQRNEIYEQLAGIFHDVFDDDTLVLTPEMTAASVPEWDSFNQVNLIVALDSRMKIKFPDGGAAVDEHGGSPGGSY